MMATMLLSGCFGGKSASSSGRGGEVVGVSGRGFKEPTPYGMTLVKRGSLRMGVEKQDSLWGKSMPVKDISVDGFWMDETEVTNSQYSLSTGCATPFSVPDWQTRPTVATRAT